MIGSISFIGTNAAGFEYGFISGNDGKRYYFDSRSTAGLRMSELYEDDVVEFVGSENYIGLAAQQMKMAVPHNGRITVYFAQKGFGFIDGKLFFHISNVENSDEFTLNTFEYEYDVSFFEVLNCNRSNETMAVHIHILNEFPKAPPLPTARTDTNSSNIKNGPLTDNDILIIYNLLESQYSVGTEVSLADLGNYLKSKNINYKSYGYDKLQSFCADLSNFLTLKNRIIGENGTQAFATFHTPKIDNQDDDQHSIAENEFEQNFTVQEEQKGYCEPVSSPITDEVKRSVYVFLLNKFKAGMQWPIAAVIRELAYAGYRKDKYGFRNRREFLAQFSDFITIENVRQNGIPDVLVTITHVTEWDDENREDDVLANGFENRQTPGINPYAHLERLSYESQRIVTAFSDVFYVTIASHLNIGARSEYDYCLLKPTSLISEQFNLTREIIVVLSAYESFEPRSLDAIGKINEWISYKSPLRLERICSVMASNDVLIANKLKDILKTNSEEMQMVIPFSFQEIMEKHVALSPADWREFVIQRFRDYFYERDLFSFRAPLKKDLYFFGRQNFVQELVNIHLSHENAGVFGLRRSGKTSILYAMQRSLDRADKKWLWVDCESIATMRWYHALYYIVVSAYKRFDLEYEGLREDYDYEQAPALFESDMNEFSKLISEESLLIMFDEIEQITFDIAIAEHWRQGADFIYFWRAIRATYQKYPEYISFIVAGTNPKAIETARINGYDNPLYQQLATEKYLPSFSVLETSDMVNKLGGYMGLKFDQTVCTLLTQDYGGQPFIIRQFCSVLNAFVNKKKYTKPRIVTKTIYDEVKKAFDNSEMLNTYCDLILEVLRDNYHEEYLALEKLALGDKKAVGELLHNKAVVSHLIGYGIITQDGDLFGFRNETLKLYILDRNRYRKRLATDEEKWQEISERRNRAETELRNIVRIQLKASLGETEAKEKVIKALESMKKLKQEYHLLEYKDLFNQKKCEVYWSEVVNLVFFNWNGSFSNIFSNKQLFKAHGDIINNLRRDCHAYEVSDDEMDSFRVSITWLEKEIENAQ